MTNRPFAGFLVLFFTSASACAGDWPRFRGPNGAGISDDKNIPATWDEKNIAWKVELPGKGHSSPIIAKEKLFIQSAAADGSERYLLCLDPKTGNTLWTAREIGQASHTHEKNTLASSTPAADDNRIYAIFWDGDKLTLNAFGYDGKPIWKTPLGVFFSEHGAGLSPVVVGDVVIVNFDMGDRKPEHGLAEVRGYNAKTGELLWTKPRHAFRACYSAPFVIDMPGKDPEVVVASTDGVTAYSPKDGAEVWVWKWKFDRDPLRTVGSPVALDGMIFAIAGDGGGDRNMVALKEQVKSGEEREVWKKTKGTAYVPSLLAKDGHVYWVSDKENVAVCVEAKTGKEQWSTRLGGGSVSASPIMVNGKIYVINEQGSVFVISADPMKFKQLGRASVGEQVYATPAVADGRLFIRGSTHLFCIVK